MFKIRITPLSAADIEQKVKWYNDPKVTQFLHYTEKFTVEKSLEWLKNIKMDHSRFENILKIYDDGWKSIGIIGLFNIDMTNKKAGFYITIGDVAYQGKGIAKAATLKFLDLCFKKFELNKIYLYTDIENITAQKLYEKVGFQKEGLLRQELYYNNRFIDRYYYGILKNDFKMGNGQ